MMYIYEVTLRTGKNRCHSHAGTIYYSNVSGLRMRASDAERFGLLIGRR